MQLSPYELKDQLLSALDKDNHVVDMRGVLEVLSILEMYPITREALEQTRIGKLVNEMRKKTDNKDLAKRAKNLVRKWQQFISQPQSHARSVNGDGIVGGTGTSLPPHLQRLGGISSKPVSPASRPATPSSNKSNVSPPSLPSVSSPALPGSRPGTPSGGGSSRLSPRLSMTRPTTPGGSTVLGSTPNHLSSTSHTLARNRVSPNTPQRPSSSYTSQHVGKDNKRPGTPSDTLSKVVANKRKRRFEDDQNSSCDGFPPIKKSMNGEQGPDSPSKFVSTRQDQSGSGDCKSSSLPISPVRNGLVGSLHDHNTAHVTTSHQPNSPNTRNLRRTSSSSSFTSTVHHSVSDIGERGGCLSNTTNLSGRRNAALKVNTDNASTPIRQRGDSCCSELSDRSRVDTPSLHTPKINKQRVKTTAELLQDLHKNDFLKLSGSETVAKIALNQIEKEPDLQDASIVPPEAKPRPRRKPGTVLPTATDRTVQQAKKERMHKFLCHSVESTSNSSDLLSMMIKEDEKKDSLRESLADYMAPPSAPLMGFTTGDTRHSSKSVLSVDSKSMEVKSSVKNLKFVPPEKAVGVKDSQPAERDVYVPGLDPWGLLPKIPVVENDDEVEGDPSSPAPVTEELVECLHTEHWQGVSGQYDYRGQWRDWKESYSASTTNDDLLHILPYVNIDF